jgi:hypothetical protein
MKIPKINAEQINTNTHKIIQATALAFSIHNKQQVHKTLTLDP